MNTPSLFSPSFFRVDMTTTAAMLLISVLQCHVKGIDVQYSESFYRCWKYVFALQRNGTMQLEPAYTPGVLEFIVVSLVLDLENLVLALTSTFV